jgi:hypothetical protein
VKLLLDAVSVSGIGVVSAITTNQVANFIAAVMFYFALRCFDHWRNKRKK